MQYQYVPYIWPLFASAFASSSLGIYALLKRRNVRGTNSFIISMFVVTIWSLGNAMEMSSAALSHKLFWANIQYIAYCYSPVTLLSLCMEFTGYDWMVRNRKVLWLAVVPTIIILFAWTDPLHGLMRYDIHMDYSGVFPVIDKEYGPLFYVHAVYSHTLNLLAWILLIRTVLFKKTVYRRQAAALLIGTSLIMFPNILYILGLSPVKYFDITPVFFGPAGVIVAWGIYRYKLFDVVPIARAAIIETMTVGMMVVDLKNRILDINPAFEKIIGYSALQIIPKKLEEVCDHIPDLLQIYRDKSAANREVTIDIDGKSRVYEVLISPLVDDKSNATGTLVVAYEITEKKLAQRAFLKQQWKLAAIEERDRMARDMHDNLGQILGFINLQAQGIRQELLNEGVNTASQRIDKLVDVTQTAHNEIREFIQNARKQEPLEKQFLAELQKQIKAFEKQSSIKVQLELSDNFHDEDLGPNITIQLLNITKEALNNIQKHSEADCAAITVSRVDEGDRLSIIIADNGKGFPVNNQRDHSDPKYGLGIMKERAAEIGAQISIRSGMSKGTIIELIVPIREEPVG